MTIHSKHLDSNSYGKEMVPFEVTCFKLASAIQPIHRHQSDSGSVPEAEGVSEKMQTKTQAQNM